jgi:guanosine-3',5'-bis(diphosphate) 3'-pyrophosphohydrolase
MELGRKLFEKEARRYDLNPKTIVDGEPFAKALEFFAVGKTDDLFAAIGYGKIQPKQVFVKIVPPESLREKPPEGTVASVMRRVLGSGEEKIKVRGIDDIMVFRARCCNPIRGEKIVGYITRGKGVSVHSATCPNVVNLLYDPERRIDVEWDKADAVARYTVKLTMEVEDRKGLLAAVSAKIADINTNIKNMEAHTDEGQNARIDMTVEINDLKHLEKVIKSLRGVDGVLGVERTGRAG